MRPYPNHVIIPHFLRRFCLQVATFRRRVRTRCGHTCPWRRRWLHRGGAGGVFATRQCVSHGALHPGEPPQTRWPGEIFPFASAIFGTQQASVDARGHVATTSLSSPYAGVLVVVPLHPTSTSSAASRLRFTFTPLLVTHSSPQPLLSCGALGIEFGPMRYRGPVPSRGRAPAPSLTRPPHPARASRPSATAHTGYAHHVSLL